MDPSLSKKRTFVIWRIALLHWLAACAAALVALLTGCGTSPSPDVAEQVGMQRAALSNGPDLVVTGADFSPANVAPGQPAVFFATVKNQGNAATPAGTIIGVGFNVDGTTISWSDTDTQSLAPGQSIMLTANSGPSGSNSWLAIAGNHSLRAWVDDVNRIAETDESNNQLFVPVDITPDLMVTNVSLSP